MPTTPNPSSSEEGSPPLHVSEESLEHPSVCRHSAATILIGCYDLGPCVKRRAQFCALLLFDYNLSGLDMSDPNYIIASAERLHRVPLVCQAAAFRQGPGTGGDPSRPIG